MLSQAIFLIIFIGITAWRVIDSVGTTTTSQILIQSTGTVSFTVSTPQDQGRWNITPENPQSTSINIVFLSVSFQTAELRVYDGSDGYNGVLLWNCASCGVISSPPPFASKTGTIIITAKGSPSVSFQTCSFSLQYFSQPLSTSVTQPVITKLTVGYAKISPILNSGYLLPNAIQVWNISTPSKNSITFSFSSFDFGASCSASLEIFDGSLDYAPHRIFRGCNSLDMPSKWLYANSGYAYIKLTNTNSYSVAVNFLLTYYSDSNLFNCGAFYQPDTLEDNSMVLTDGSMSTSFMRRGADCEWLIQPTQAGSTVTLLMDWVSIMVGGIIMVYDNNAASGYVLWNCQGSTLTTPPPIISTNGYLYIVYKSSTQISNGFYGFKGRYMSNYDGTRGMGSMNSLLSMSSVIDLTPPGPADASSYTSNLTYTWFVQPSSIAGVITFSFSLLNITDTSDRLIIYDGSTVSSPIIGNFSGTTTPTRWYRSSSSSATIVFSSNNNNFKYGGFRLSYFANGPNYHCGFTRNPALLTAASLTITDGSSSTEVLYSSQTCQWSIAPIDSTGVYLFFSTFNVIGGYVNIYIGDISSNVLYFSISSSSAVPAPIYLPYSKIGISYVSSSSASGYGFSLTYFGISSNYIGPGDNTIVLSCSSALSLSIAGTNSPSPTSDLLWIITPTSSLGHIYFSIHSFESTTGYLEIRDGNSISSPLLVTLTNNSQNFRSWIRTSSTSATLRYIPTSNKTIDKSFDISYYSDGPNYHCGFASNPAQMRAGSMVFTDGSASSSQMYENQFCEWLISPGQGTLVLEFVVSDLQGASIAVYDGSSTSDTLVWECIGCSYVPRPMISSSGNFFVSFSSSAGVAMGYGFRALYWTANLSLSSWMESSSYIFLQSPPNVAMDRDTNNLTTSWILGVSSETSYLSYYPYYAESDVNTFFDSSVSDGRNSDPLFSSLSDTISTCGYFKGSNNPVLMDQDFYDRTPQYLNTYLQSRYSYKNILKIEPTQSINDRAGFSPTSTCKYQIINDYSTSFTINVNNFGRGFAGRLLIYTGIYGNDHLSFDSNSISSFASSIPVLAPCGKATILLYVNESINTTIDYFMDLSYARNAMDEGQDCQAYIQSLLPVVKKANPWINVYIGGGVALAVIIAGVVSFIYRKKISKYFAMKKKRTYTAVTPSHPKYTPRLDEWKNKFLATSTCVICNESLKTFQLPCKHNICMEDLKGYLNSALGDISMFPVKCPMHYQGCTGNIDANMAKRVLSQALYEKFIEFSDRAVYGDGMRCIFCSNFVNFPAEGITQAMVECPYCIQRFCLRCKKPWHIGNKCPLDNVDDSLESWKKASGAQKCPSCHKLIEKEDPNTCNHMVHKITDGIPCIRDRTDFCYLCGEEVAPDYPHNEINNPGVNHFPDGVFQKCRIITLREKEAERERLKKMRRARNNKKKTAISPADGGDTDDELGLPINGGVLDRFDAQWDQMRTVPLATNNAILLNAALQHDEDIESGEGSLPVNTASVLVQSPAPSTSVNESSTIAIPVTPLGTQLPSPPPSTESPNSRSSSPIREAPPSPSPSPSPSAIDNSSPSQSSRRSNRDRLPAVTVSTRSTPSGRRAAATVSNRVTPIRR